MITLKSMEHMSLDGVIQHSSVFERTGSSGL